MPIATGLPPCPQNATFSVTHAVFKLLLKIGQCKMQTADWLWTTVFRVEKQWGYCCHVLICTVNTIVCSLYFSLTAAEIHSDWTFYCFKIISVNWAYKSSWTLAILVKNELFCHSWSNLGIPGGHFSYFSLKFFALF